MHLTITVQIKAARYCAPPTPSCPYAVTSEMASIYFDQIPLVHFDLILSPWYFISVIYINTRSKKI